MFGFNRGSACTLGFAILLLTLVFSPGMASAQVDDLEAFNDGEKAFGLDKGAGLCV